MPLSVEFTDWMDERISEIIFGKDNKRVVTSHSTRKDGATSAHAAGPLDHEVRILGHWSIGILDYYEQTQPEKFRHMHSSIAKWALKVYKERVYIAPVIRSYR